MWLLVVTSNNNISDIGKKLAFTEAYVICEPLLEVELGEEQKNNDVV